MPGVLQPVHQATGRPLVGKGGAGAFEVDVASVAFWAAVAVRRRRQTV